LLPKIGRICEADYSAGEASNHVNKINLFNKVLGLIADCLLYGQETKLNQFEPMPFHRLFYMLLFEATLPRIT
jgi:hypothetical protein